MRKAWQKWPPRFEALKRVRRPYVGPNTRQKWEYQCAHCSGWFLAKEVSVDHITPWGSLNGLSNDEAWARLLVHVDALQILCKPCHDRKTDSE
jgi:5-methylcytosine-specific restriction endonuclease McrA